MSASVRRSIALLTFPNQPDLIEIQNTEFSEHAYQRVWAFFVDHAKKDPNGGALSKRQQLESFARNLKENEQLQNLLKAHNVGLRYMTQQVEITGEWAAFLMYLCVNTEKAWERGLGGQPGASNCVGN